MIQKTVRPNNVSRAGEDSPAILDSGERRHFESGAVRDIASGKGRCDLVPISTAASVMFRDNDPIADILASIDSFQRSLRDEHLHYAIERFCKDTEQDMYTCFLEVSKQYEGGAAKYGEHNWEKGIPAHCYIDSAIRHLMKFYRGDADEPHGRAFVWNILGLAWTVHNRPDLIDFPTDAVIPSHSESIQVTLNEEDMNSCDTCSG